jgi:hypothetical protein
MSLSSQTQPPRFRVVPRGLAAAAQQPAVLLKPFAPVLQSKEVELQFTVSLQRFDFFLDGSKMPNLKSADWKPSHAIASWASWSRNEKTGKVVMTADAPFACKEAAAVGCTGAAVCALRAEWRDGTASAAEITKKLKLQPGGSAFDDHFIQITVFSAKQEYLKPKDGSAPSPKPPTQTCDIKSKPIALGASLLLNLSVRRPPPPALRALVHDSACAAGACQVWLRRPLSRRGSAKEPLHFAQRFHPVFQHHVQESRTGGEDFQASCRRRR